MYIIYRRVTTFKGHIGLEIVVGILQSVYHMVIDDENGGHAALTIEYKVPYNLMRGELDSGLQFKIGLGRAARQELHPNLGGRRQKHIN